MPESKDNSIKMLQEILQDKSPDFYYQKLKVRSPKKEPLPESISRGSLLTKEIQSERIELLEKQGIVFEYVNGKKHIDDPGIFESNIENYIGLAQVPVGVIGPLRINGLFAHGDFYVPLATTEGALVASYNRGAKVISMSGGARVVCLNERISRAPAFAFSDLLEVGEFLVWAINELDKFKEVADQTTNHGSMEDMKVTVEGNHVYINYEYTTGDASGQNMVTIATKAVCDYIIENSPVKPQHHFVEGNTSGDKKATSLSFLNVRGKKVVAEVTIPRRIFEKFLHTSPEMMMEYWKMSFVGGVQSGSIGVQGHYSNGLAAIFLACGQDVACVSEASMGITRVDIDKNGDLYMSITMPNMVVGTVGGGTNLPTQRECLTLLGCKGDGTAKKFAEICTATVLAGEISIMGAMAAGHFAQAHQAYGRKKNSNEQDQ